VKRPIYKVFIDVEGFVFRFKKKTIRTPFSIKINGDEDLNLLKMIMKSKSIPEESIRTVIIEKSKKNEEVFFEPKWNIELISNDETIVEEL